MHVGTDSVKNIASLFDGTNQYQIPRYQRRYIWDMTNWDALWRDFLQLQRQIEDGEKNKKHFTGTIITHIGENDSHRKNDVIDGQQRLTTFQVIFSVIRDLCESGAYQVSITSQLESAVKGFTRLNLLEMGETDTSVNVDNSAEDDWSSYRLIPTSYDREAFQSVISGKFGQQIKKAAPNVLEVFQSLLLEGEQSNQNLIITAYGYFGTKIVEYLEKNGFHKLLSLSRTLSRNFHVIKVDLDLTDEPEKIFETINDTGRMLDDFDYLRNHLFLRARKLEEPEIEELYNKYWKKFENWDSKGLSLFFRAFLTAKLGPKHFQDKDKSIKLFDLYREYSNSLTESTSQNQEYANALTESLNQGEKPLSSVEYELNQLSCYANSCQELNTSTPVSKDSDLKTFGNRMQFYDNLNLPRLDAFILFLKHRFGFSGALLHNVCDVLESYIIRQMLCGKHDEGIYAEINSFFSKALEAARFTMSDFVGFLYGSLDPQDQVRNALDRAWSKDTNLILYILYRIELFKREQRQDLDTPLSFEELKVRERIVSPVQSSDYYATESIGNITPLRLVLDDWDYCTFTAKRRLLVRDIAIDLILSREIHDEDGWDTNPVSEIKSRTQDLLFHFDRIWQPVLQDYI